jgi:hypothetical protein
MKFAYKIRQELIKFGFRSNMGSEIQALEAQFTVCQLIVVVLSIISVVFLFIPFFYLQDIRFVIGFFGLSILFLIFGTWFWLKRYEICEHPEEYNGK